jgi:hypothetical protein
MTAGVFFLGASICLFGLTMSLGGNLLRHALGLPSVAIGVGLEFVQTMLAAEAVGFPAVLRAKRGIFHDTHSAYRISGHLLAPAHGLSEGTPGIPKFRHRAGFIDSPCTTSRVLAPELIPELIP